MLNNINTIELVKFIVGEYQTKTVQKIHEGMTVTHPDLKLTKSQVGNLIKECKRSFDRRSAQCRANSQFKEAAAIEARKFRCLPDKRSKFRAAVDQVVDFDIIENVVDEALNKPDASNDQAAK
jgi:hypothetical protein